MKPESPPKRASSRIKAKVNAAAAAEGTPGTTAASSARPAPSLRAGQRAIPQAPTVMSHGFGAAASSGGQPAAVGVRPKISGVQSRQNSHAAAAAPNTGPHPPYHHHGADPSHPGPPPPYAPPPYPGAYAPVDPKVMEERKRAALAYAMQDHVGGTRGRRRVGVTKTSNDAAANVGANTSATAHGFTSNASAPAAAARSAAAGVPRPNYPPASKLISGVHALAQAASQQSDAENPTTAEANNATAVNAAAPSKRKPGRPRKNDVAASADGTSNASVANEASTVVGTTVGGGTVKRKLGRPKKVSVPHPSSPQGKAAAAAARAAEAVARTQTITGRKASGPTINAASSSTSGVVVRADSTSSDAATGLNSLAFNLQKDLNGCADNAQVTVANPISQSLPSSNANSDDDARAVRQQAAATKSSQIAQSQQQSAQSQQQGTQSQQSNYNPLPLKRASTDASSVYDDEYARFMRSLLGDDQSIITFRTLQSIKGGASVAGKGSVVGSAFETLDEDDVSYQLTSEEEDDDDEDDDEDLEMEDAGDGDNGGTMHQASPQKKSTAAPLSDTPMGDVLPDEDLFNVLGEIEGLMEEDLEAAVMASLIGGPSESEANAAPSTWGCISGMGGVRPGVATKPPGRGPSNNSGAIMGTQQQAAITTPGFTTKKKKSTTTVVTTPSPMPGARGRQANAHSVEVPAVSKDQLARLRSIMALHHQLLLQQATLSVRAAYVQKVRKDGVSAAGASASRCRLYELSQPSPPPAPVPKQREPTGKKDSSLPESRLDTKSLTFCSTPYAESGCSYVNDFFGGETPEELSECLDGAVGMLQDLEQNWKDAVRNSIQLPAAQPPPSQVQGGGRCRNLNFGETTSQHSSSNSNHASTTTDSSRRLTRSAFTKTLLERELEMSSASNSSTGGEDRAASPAKKQLASSTAQYPPSRVSVFDVRGLSRLKETFSALDNSVKDIQMGREKGKNKDGLNILAPDVHGKACEQLLKHAKAEIDMEYLPGGSADLGKCLTHAPEAFDDPDRVQHPLTKKHEAELRRNRHTFTAGEDNLILRGVNLYGEKEWCLVSDRFLPDRVVNSISQRYNKLCFLIYKANGIGIDEKGKLPPIPTFSKGAIYDMTKVAKIKPARAPTTMNVHRWTMEEDIAILKAVPVMGNLWAEICTKLMPHRDRGHIRKRFQVLQRRIPKGITKMNYKYLKRPAEQPPKPAKSPKRAKTPRSPAKKRVIKKKASPKKAAPTNKFPATTTSSASLPPTSPVKSAARPPPTSPAKIFAQAAAARAAAASPASPSPANIFQQAAQQAAQYRRPPMSPIRSDPAPQSPPKLETNPESPRKQVRPFANRGVQALSQAFEAVESGAVMGEPSPETRVLASLLGGFSQGSRLGSFPHREHEENTQMGVEKILGNTDDWSQASGMQRLIEAGAAESNFVRDRHHGEAASPAKPSELPMYQVQDGDASGLSVINSSNHAAIGGLSNHGERKSILSSVMEKTNENALKRKSSTAFPSTPTKHGSPSQTNVLPAPEGYPSSIPTSSISFNLDTPVKGLGMGLDAAGMGETTNQEFFEMFMSDKSRQASTPGRAGTMRNSSAKASMMMSPIKLGNMAPTTPLSQFGTIGALSGPLDGENSLLMHASDFDAVAALTDLSNSAPNTPSKLLRPRESSQGTVSYNHDVADGAEEEEEEKQVRRKKPKTSFFGQVKAKVDERKK